MASKGGKTRSRRKARKGAPGEGKPARPGFWDGLTPRNRHLIAAGVLLIVSAVFFAPATFQGKTLVGSDTLQSRAMAKSLTDYHNETGEIALWATNLFSGMPGYLIHYPKVAVQIDAVAFWSRRVLWPTVQFLILVLGVYALVFYLTSNTLAALISALGAGLTTYIPVILSVGHTSKFMALSWLPWVMFAFVHILRNPRVIWAAVFAVLLAVELRAGHPQISYYAAWLLGVWWISEGVSSFRTGAFREFVKATGVLALGTALAVLMVAQPYWSQYEFKAYTIRGGNAALSGGESTGLGWDYAMNWSQGRAELLTLFVADLFGGGSPTYWGVKPFTEGPHYLGGVILLLAIIAVVGRRGRTVRGLAIGTLLLTLFALGKNAAWINRPLFDHFPLFSAFRAPEMWLHLVELGLAILAGLGAAFIVQREHFARRKTITLWVAGGVLAFSLLLTLGGSSMFSFERDGEAVRAAQQLAARENVSPADPAVQQAVTRYLADVRSTREDLFTRDAIRTTLILVFAAGLLWLYFGGKIRPWMMLGGLALLVLFDLWGVGKRHLGPEHYTSGSVDQEIQAYAFDQFILDRVEEAGGPGHFRALSLESSPVNWARPAFYYETSGGYNAAKLQVYQDFIDNIFFDPASGLPTVLGLDLTATRYVVSNRALPGMRSVFRDPSTPFAVLERVGGRDRTSFVDSFQVMPDADATFAYLNGDSFDPETDAVLGTDPGIESAPIDSAATVDVTLLEYGAHRIVWDVETDRPRVLVTSEVYYPAGWTAFVDDDEVPIIQTNHAFRSVVVPAGAHRVTMVFDPESHTVSSWIAVIATIFVYGWLILFGVMYGIRKRKKSD